MWALRQEVGALLDLRMGDWNMSPEIKLKALVHPSIRFGEFHICQQERYGSSHQRYLRTGVSHAVFIIRHRLGWARPTRPDPSG